MMIHNTYGYKLLLLWCIVSLCSLSLYQVVIQTQKGSSSLTQNESSSSSSQPTAPRVVISIGFCLSSRAQKVTQEQFKRHKHANKPYGLAALLSTRLWKQQNASLRVLVSLVHPGDEEGARQLKQWAPLLERAGADLWVLDTSKYKEDPYTACVRAAQISRSFVHEYRPSDNNFNDHSSSLMIHPNDIVITSDCDALPYNASQRLEPISQLQPNQAWVSTYDKAIQRNLGSYLMCHIGMMKQTWQHAWALSNFTLDSAIRESLFHSNRGRFGWNTDQALVSSAVTNAKLCTIPFSNHKMYWRSKSYLLESAEVYASHNDTETCLRGTDETDESMCKITGNDTSYLRRNCSIAHFTHSANAQELMYAYETIGRRYPNFVEPSVLFEQSYK